MSRVLGAAVVGIFAVLVLVSCDGHQPVANWPQPLIAPKDGPVLVNARVLAGLGPVLVDARGYTLYVFPPDDGRLVTCAGACLGSWPPLTVPPDTTVRASDGVQQALLGTVIGPSGRRVVTYAGWPLYAYAGDVQPGQANGQGLNLNGDSWFVMNPAGKAVVPPEQEDLMPPGTSVSSGATGAADTMPGMSTTTEGGR